MRTQSVLAEIRGLVEGISPLDALEDDHRHHVLRWLDRTDDVFRRAKPRTPAQHLVSYFLLVDPDGPHFLLGDHIKAGLWLPTGGHVEPNESPVETVRREVREELGITARFPERTGEKPVFLTVTETVESAEETHTDVSLWFVLAGQRGQVLRPDPSEFRSVRWWSRAEVVDCGFAMFDPHLMRMLEKVDQLVSTP